MPEEHPDSRGERRARRRRQERARMAKHGASLRRVYPGALLKRARAAKGRRLRRRA